MQKTLLLPLVLLLVFLCAAPGAARRAASSLHKKNKKNKKADVDTMPEARAAARKSWEAVLQTSPADFEANKQLGIALTNLADVGQRCLWPAAKFRKSRLWRTCLRSRHPQHAEPSAGFAGDCQENTKPRCPTSRRPWWQGRATMKHSILPP